MKSDPATEFISKITVTNRMILLSIMQKLYFAIHELFLKELKVTEHQKNLIEIKRAIKPSDFSSVTQYFTEPVYKHDLFVPQHLPSNLKEQNNKKVSIAGLKGKILKIKENSKKDALIMKLSNEYFNFERAIEISDLVLNIKNIRNNNEHETPQNEISKAMLLHANINRLLDLTPDHILESMDEFDEYENYLKQSSVLFHNAYNPADEIDSIPQEIPKPEFNYEELKSMISNELRKQAEASEKSLADLKNDLQEMKKKISVPQLQIKAVEDASEPEISFLDTPSFSRKAIPPPASKQKMKSEKLTYEKPKLTKSYSMSPTSPTQSISPAADFDEGSLDIKEIKKSSKSVREELISLRDKIYTIISNTGHLEYWDCILNTRIIANIIINKLYTLQEFKLSQSKPGYSFITTAGGGFAERSQESKRLMDLQLEIFWPEVQEITQTYFFDFSYIFNLRGKPWAINNKEEYIEKFIKEEPETMEVLTEYLGKPKGDLSWRRGAYKEFSPAFLRAWCRTIKKYPKPKFFVFHQRLDDGWIFRLANSKNFAQVAKELTEEQP